MSVKLPLANLAGPIAGFAECLREGNGLPVQANIVDKDALREGLASRHQARSKRRTDRAVRYGDGDKT